MNKLIKYTIIAFISFNVLGGVVLGTREYIEEQEAKQAFENFYKSDTQQVMGAYDKKPVDNQSLYILSGMLILILPLIMGVTGAHLVMKKKQRKIKRNEPILVAQPTEEQVSKKIIHL